MADVASARLGLRRSEFGWALEELWVSGELLGPGHSIEAGSVVLMLDLPTAELPWLAIHPTGEWIGEQLRLGKRPIRWCYRPLAWPAWNHEHRRVARFWAAATGLDADVIDGLRARHLDQVPVVAPSADDLQAQLRTELTASRRHLRTVLDGYWNDRWRRDHDRFDDAPEDHLWRAASAVADMQDALDDLASDR